MKEFKIYKNTYIDSVTLMSTTSRLKISYSLTELVMLMATSMNIELIQSVGFKHPDLTNCNPADLIIAIDHDSDVSLIDSIFDQLTNPVGAASSDKVTYKRIEEVGQDYNVAIISVAGQYAAYEAQKALDQDLHVMMFSDNVSIEDEIRLKNYAISKNLLMMGPDCGTAIINGIGLCFANQLRVGPISLVAASGTGLQEVTVLIDQLGGGVRQAIGVGGRDLTEAIGGLMMNASLKAIQHDEDSKVVVVISKPPAASVEMLILKTLKAINKPVVVCFLDSSKTGTEDNLHFVQTLSDAALKAVELQGLSVTNINLIDEQDIDWIQQQRSIIGSSRGYLRALYCGGTLTAETLSLLRHKLPNVTSNVAKRDNEKMLNPMESVGHCLVDLGDDVFTDGRPHPMIEPSIRLERILLEASNPDTKVILLDFELGYGSHEDSIGITLPAIIKAQLMASNQGRHLSFVGYVLGTQTDKQKKSIAEEQLRQYGVYVARTNTHAANICAAILEV